tara:strand:- start:3934 stop:4362 length:429 start_codon:yes stop_codon:yes gene_type:complete
MKIFLIASLLISTNLVFGAGISKVIVVYKPDKTVSVIHPLKEAQHAGESINQFLQRIYSESVAGTDLEGLPYDIMNKSGLPDRNNRDAWEGEQGEGVTTNTVKAAQINKQKRREELIKKRMKKNNRDKAEAELISEGKIEEE